MEITTYTVNGTQYEASSPREAALKYCHDAFDEAEREIVVVSPDGEVHRFTFDFGEWLKSVIPPEYQ